MMKPSIFTHLAGIVAIVLSGSSGVGVYAATYVGDQTMSAPFSAGDSVNVAGNLTLLTPGTYSAMSWRITGELRFGAPGAYTVIASAPSPEGTIAIGGNIRGADSGTADATIKYLSMVCYGRPVSGVKLNLVNQSSLGGGSVSVSLPVFAVEEGMQPPTTPSMNPPLINISTRGTLGPGGMMTAGFVVGGTSIRRVLIRGVGPALAKFGITDALADPELQIYQGTRFIGANKDWNTVGKTSAMFAAVGAFALDPFSHDSAFVLTLAPGSYTAQIHSSNPSDAGEVLVEIYFID